MLFFVMSDALCALNSLFIEIFKLKRIKNAVKKRKNRTYTRYSYKNISKITYVRELWYRKPMKNSKNAPRRLLHELLCLKIYVLIEYTVFIPYKSAAKGDYISSC